MEVMEIIEMVNNLVTCIYECGSIINRIDHHLTEAENLIDKGVTNLEDIAGPAEELQSDTNEKKDGVVEEAKKKVEKKLPLMYLMNRLRGITYGIIVADYVMNILFFVV